MANSSAFKSSPVFLRVQKTYTALHLNLLAVDRWELINKDMVWRAQDVRRKLASEVEYLGEKEWSYSYQYHGLILNSPIRQR